MLRTVVLSLILVVSLSSSSSSSSSLRKSISRRQAEPQSCQAIEGFDCKCSHYRVTCTTDRELPSQINVLPNEKQKYQSVELVIAGERDQTVHEHTLEPAKQLFKTDSDNLEFRVKFEKFTSLNLQSPGVFNRVFPDNLPSDVRKSMALEIYNPSVQANDNVNLFANLNVDSLELYVLFPFRGTFQQLFNGANIKTLRLSGGDIKSDVSQPFTGNIGKLELAKQAAQLSAQNFPVYPAHELIINAFYVNDFSSEHPPNYSNLAELRVHSQERIPANAFRHFTNLHTLSVSTEKDIDPHAFDNLQNLEKLTIKDTKPSLELLNNLPNVKEFEASIEKLNEQEQCQLVEKLANGQVAIQAVPNGRECTCVSAYLSSAAGQYVCDAANCDQSSCAAIRNNYDASARTFKAPPPIRRADGSDALRPREPKNYNAPFQVSQQDQSKLQQASPPQEQQPSGQDGDTQQQQQQQQQYHQQDQQQQQQQQQQPQGVTPAGQSKKSRRTRPRTQTTTPSQDPYQNAAGQGHWQQQPQDPSQQQHQQQHHQQQPYDSSQQQPYDPSQQQHQQQPYDPSQQQHHDSSQQQHQDPSQQHQQQPYDPSQQQPYDPSQQQPQHPYHPDPNAPQQGTNQGDTSGTGDGNENQQREEGTDNRQGGDGSENQQGEEGNENQQGGEPGRELHPQPNENADPNQTTQVAAVDGSDTSAPPAKKKFNWIPIIIIAASIIGLLIIGFIILFLRKRQSGGGYTTAATSESAARA